ncbi:restriction endonuclease subunit S [Gottfriedia acidiceleris]|uniref:Restriction endonuclease subunit S n=1 Tax=Gottfriedia acidiceleris TaxID=371036 RepID=A0ABY4JG34_9BACI|nr:restriction endonuclease subunit S [Gottfriedia acidiceleris]UPM52447.1 restriction endonuclease subunit S [Gottfriedia acidiceleris]
MVVKNIKIQNGYKDSEIGLIPETWEIKSFEEIGQCLIGLTYKPENVKNYGLLVLRSSNIGGNNLKFEDNVYVDIEVDEKIKVKENDLLICVRNGSRNLIGKCALIDKRTEGSTFGAFMSVFRSPINEFIYYCFQSETIKKQIQSNLGATINQITNKNLNSFIVALPNDSNERSAITTALSDLDSLIFTLEKLIIKKRLIKQGTMQLLLTGKKRLQGFNDNWVEKKLGDIAEIISGGTPSTSVSNFWNGDIKWCTPTDITNTKGKYIYDTEKKITIEGLKSSSATLLPIGSLLLCSRATIGDIRIAASEISTNQGFKSLIPFHQISGEFIFYYIQMHKHLLIEKAIGSTFLEISKKDTFDLILKIPPTKEEQTEIANVLSVMDMEIEKIEQKLVKYKNIKLGMIQDLLTGKRRLV